MANQGVGLRTEIEVPKAVGHPTTESGQERQRGEGGEDAPVEITGEGIPVEIGPTTRERHITGMTALNIPDPGRPGGDWHSHASWFGTEERSLSETSYSDTETYGTMQSVLGNAGIRDARPGLAELGHPAGAEPRPVWASSYDRAVIEVAWEQIMMDRQYETDEEYPPADSRETGRWIFRTLHWLRLNWWAWRLRWRLTGREREKWDTWRREWRPW